MMHEAFDELMSLKLDGLIDDAGERRLNEHLGQCDICARMWSLFQQADSMMWTSAQEPLQVPSTLHARVMVQIAAPALQSLQGTATSTPLFFPSSTGRLGDAPSFLGVGVPAMAATSTTGGLVSLPAHTRRLPVAPTASLTDNADWQRRTVGYLRSTAAIILSLTGLASLFLALAMSGIIKLEGAAGDWVSTLRTVFEGVGAWFQSLFTASGSALVAGSALVLGILVLVGWQVVANYQRNLIEGRGHTGALTGSLTGPLEVAA